MRRMTFGIFCVWMCLSSAWGEGPPATGMKILAGARQEVRNGTLYDGSDYRVIPYPGGDIDRSIGVCTDLIVRAFRNAGHDLQKLLFEDRSDHPQAYPNLWEKKKPDSNIDHRRCQNLVVFFDRHARRLANNFHGEKAKDWQAGDVVFFVREGEKHPWHVAIVSDRLTSEGVPYVVHLFPPQAAEIPVNTTYLLPIHSRFRWVGKTPSPPPSKTSEPAGEKKPASVKPFTFSGKIISSPGTTGQSPVSTGATDSSSGGRP